MNSGGLCRVSWSGNGDELKSTWRKAHRAEDTRRCIVDLIEVTSIDRNGEGVLAEIMSQGAKLISGDVYTKHLLRNLRNELKRSRMKEKQDGGDHHDKAERSYVPGWACRCDRASKKSLVPASR